MSIRQEGQVKGVLSSDPGMSHIYIQQFQHLAHTITNENQWSVNMVMKQPTELQILNHYAIVSGQIIEKVTQIILEDRVIKIIDHFSITSHFKSPQPIKVANPEKLQKKPKRQVLTSSKPSFMLEEGAETQKSNPKVKYVVKNIVNLFKVWLNKEHHSFCEPRIALQWLITHHKKFNNSLIVGITKNLVLRNVFKKFIQEQAELKISESKITDKKSHLETLRRYLQLYLRENICQETKNNHLNTKNITNEINQSCLIQGYQESNEQAKIKDSLNSLSH